MPSLSGALSPTPRKMNRAAHFSPRPMRGGPNSKTFDSVSASTEVLLQERAANLWASPDQIGASAEGKFPTPCTAKKLKVHRPSVDEWIRLQACSDAATHEKLMSTAGLPFADRRQAWLAWSGAYAARKSHATDHYASLQARWASYQALNQGGNNKISQTVPSPVALAATGELPLDFARSLETIGRDLTRTCQEHEYFSDGDGLEVLERVLACSLLHSPTLGYTQGMNYLAAFLLLTLQLADGEGAAASSASAAPVGGGTSQRSEENCAPAHPNINAADAATNGYNKPPVQQTPNTENGSCFHLGAGHVTAQSVEADAFWLLNSLLSRFEGYFRDGFPTLLRDTELLGALLKDECGIRGKHSSSSSSLQPSLLATHLEDCGFDLLMYTPKWLICLFLNTLPGHVAVRIWDLALWHGGATPSWASSLPTAAREEGAGTGTEVNHEETCIPNAAEKETWAVNLDGGHGVLLWAGLGILRGLAPGLQQCHDFESVDTCLKQGLDEKVRSFGWLQRHCGSSILQVVADVRSQCAHHRATGNFKVAPPVTAIAATAATVVVLGPKSLQDTSFRARAAASGNSDSSHEKQEAWYLQCASERALVIGLAAAKSTAGELRLADEQSLQEKNKSGSMSTTDGSVGENASQLASVKSLVNDLGLGEDPLPDALRLLLAAHPLPDTISVTVGAGSGKCGSSSSVQSSSSDASVLRPAGTDEGAAALALLRTFALAYASQQEKRASRDSSGATKKQAPAASPLSAEAIFLVSVASILASAHFHRQRQTNFFAAAQPSLSADAFVRAINNSLDSSSNSGKSSAAPKSLLLMAYKNALDHPLVGEKHVPGQSQSAASVSEVFSAATFNAPRDFGSAMSRLSTFFPASATKAPATPAAAATTGSSFRALFTGTPRRKLDPSAQAGAAGASMPLPTPAHDDQGSWWSASRQAHASLNHALASPSPRLLSPLKSPPPAKHSQQSQPRSTARKDQVSLCQGNQNTADALAEMVGAPPASVHKGNKRLFSNSEEKTAAAVATGVSNKRSTEFKGASATPLHDQHHHLLQSPEGVGTMECPTPRSDLFARSDGRARKPLFSPEAIELKPLAPP